MRVRSPIVLSVLSPAVPVSARSGSNANRFNQGTGGGNRVLRIIADAIQRTGDVELYGIEIQECRLFDDGRNNGPARLPCRKLGFAADDRRVAGRR